MGGVSEGLQTRYWDSEVTFGYATTFEPTVQFCFYNYCVIMQENVTQLVQLVQQTSH